MIEIFTGHKRNQPCYCGSSKKYKVCHYRIDSDSNEAEKEIFRKQEEELSKKGLKLLGGRNG